MPQLDLYSILNQFFWGSFFFVIFYYLITFFFIPTFFTSLYARKAFSDSRAHEISCLVSVVFLAHVLITSFFDSLFDDFSSFFDYLIYSRVVTSSVYDAAFTLEFQKAYEMDSFENSSSN